MAIVDCIRPIYNKIFEKELSYDITDEEKRELQCMVYLLQEAGLPMGYHYSLTHRYPYSSDLGSDIYYKRMNDLYPIVGEFTPNARECCDIVKKIFQMGSGYPKEYWMSSVTSLLCLKNERNNWSWTDAELLDDLKKRVSSLSDRRCNEHALEVVKRFYCYSESEKSAAKIFCEYGFHKDITPNEFDDRLDQMPMSEIREIMWKLYLRADED